MATSLHQQLKLRYCNQIAQHEILLGDYRIDAVDADGRLIEIQCASLGAIRSKVQRLLRHHDVIVVKPLASRKQIVRQDTADGEMVSRRYSPTRQSLVNIFKELVHFTRVFPHPRLQLHVLLTEQREIRLPPTDRSSWRKQYSVHDRELVAVDRQYEFRTAQDVWQALELTLPPVFTTAELGEALGSARWMAQKVAYCFRQMGWLELDSKRGNSLVYRLASASGTKRRSSTRVTGRQRPAA